MENFLYYLAQTFLFTSIGCSLFVIGSLGTELSGKFLLIQLGLAVAGILTFGIEEREHIRQTVSRFIKKYFRRGE